MLLHYKGHTNIKKILNIYTIGKYLNPPTTYIMYIDVNENIITNPIDISASEIMNEVVNIPTVNLPTPEEEAEFEEQDEIS